MACNIIMTDTGSLRATQFNSTATYNIEDINFYIPQTKAINHQIFLMLKNEKNLYDIVELTKINSNQSGSNILFKVPLKQALRINNENVILNFMLIDSNNSTCSYSQSMKIHIATDNYILARQVYISQQIGQKVQDLYMKILSLTEENRSLFQKIQKGDYN